MTIRFSNSNSRAERTRSVAVRYHRIILASARTGIAAVDTQNQTFLKEKKQAGGNTDDEYARHPFGYDLLVARGWTIAPVNGDTKMAKVDLFQSPGNGTFLFYNLDASVGKGGAIAGTTCCWCST
jgi:hypothetical protein